MDREKAIEMLAGRYLIYVDEDSKTAKEHTRMVNEALDLAIEALEREVEYGQIEVSEDCISRQALIDEILEDGNGAVLSYTKGMDEDDLVERIEERMIQHFIGVIEYAPPVAPTEKIGGGG